MIDKGTVGFQPPVSRLRLPQQPFSVPYSLNRFLVSSRPILTAAQQEVAGRNPPTVPQTQPIGVHETHCSAKVNIWQIGMIMRCLIRQDNEATQWANHIDYNNVPNWTVLPAAAPAAPILAPPAVLAPAIPGLAPVVPPPPPPPPPPPINNWNPPVESPGTVMPPGTYSQALVNLTATCLESDPNNRPTPTALLASILANGVPDHMDTKVQPMNRPLRPNHHNAVKRLDQKKKYAVGMSARGFH